ncbi:MAG: hypothetical protein OXD46_02865 [Chloroflexi bacterium]|nr:hypothetical protein [Chloroflexota bacterium]
MTETEERQEIEHMKDVMYKYMDLFTRQPTYHSVGVGPFFLSPPPDVYSDEHGIEVWVEKKVDQSTLPEEDRIPDCLEGVPVRILEKPRLKIT